MLTRTRAITVALTGALAAFAIVLMLPGESQAAGATIVVNTTADVIANDEPADLCSIREAVQATRTNASVFDDCTHPGNGDPDRIVLDGGTTYTLSAGVGDDFGDLDLVTPTSGNLTIQADAPNAIIDANMLGRVMEIASNVPTVTLDHITIQNGLATGGVAGNVGGIETVGNLTLNDSAVLNNTGLFVGGINSELGSETTLNDSTISGNNATSPASGIPVGGIRNSGGILTIDDSTISDNHSDAFPSGTGGILSINANAVVTITDSTLSGNSGRLGGAIHNGGTTNNEFLDLTNVTISGNSSALGAGIYLISSGDTVNLTNVTIADNISDGASGIDGVYRGSGDGTANFRNTIVVAGEDGHFACGGQTSLLVSLGGNLENAADCSFTQPTDRQNANPMLGPLQINAPGATATHELLSGSDAVNTGVNTGCASLDQRGVPRPQGGVCDIGAYESNFTGTFTITATPSPSPSATPSPTATPVQTATPTPGSTLTQGDVDCDGDVDADDALLLLLFAVALDDGNPAPCPDVSDDVPGSDFPWGDVNCDGVVDELDAVYVLAFVASVPPPAVAGCVSVGTEIV